MKAGTYMIVDEHLSCSNLGTLCEGVHKDKSSFKSYRMAGGFGAATLSPWSLHWLRRAVAALVHPRPLVTTRPVSQHKISDTISQGNFGASMCQDVVNLACDQVRQQSQAHLMILPFSRKSLFLPGQVVVGFIRQFPAMCIPGGPALG